MVFWFLRDSNPKFPPRNFQPTLLYFSSFFFFFFLFIFLLFISFFSFLLSFIVPCLITYPESRPCSSPFLFFSLSLLCSFLLFASSVFSFFTFFLIHFFLTFRFLSLSCRLSLSVSLFTSSEVVRSFKDFLCLYLPCIFISFVTNFMEKVNG